MKHHPTTPKPAILGSCTGNWDLSIADKHIDLYKVEPDISWYEYKDTTDLYIIPANPNLNDSGNPSLEELRDFLYDEFLLSIKADGDDADISDYFPDYFNMVAQWMAIQGQETFNWFCTNITANDYFQKVNDELEDIDGSRIEIKPEDYDQYLKWANDAQEIYNTYCK